ncbi:WD40-repeat-containing domain protein [Lasiosphaeria miniovina]|uniref:WD40-repeat-containing domain protein n=1 Tax=Lasiosphaeria miniovina TaxID=1954250 RepID=A0AA40E4C9_9PEZI|nr:WD40-repeat-containing domain protein [Lasiosphaeria miniovina]KAK0722088.1 WD40-repeat-containing domain protein [Lasiosphaeria miniovina]
MAPATQFEIAQSPGDALTAVVFAPDDPSRLLVSSWDRKLYMYDVAQGKEEATLVKTFDHRAPVLAVCFGANKDVAFTGGVDRWVKKINLATGEQTVLSEHTAPVRCVVYSPDHSILISASWDCSLHIHHISDDSKPSTPLKIQLPGKAYSLAASPSKVVVAMTARLVHIYDLPTIASVLALSATSNGHSDTDAKADNSGIPTPVVSDIQPWQQRESPLKFLTRAVSCMPNDAGYATSSIEGRVAVEWFEDTPESQARKYAFKCHRQVAPEEEGGGDIVYPVHALAFHPVYGTFASGGGDGTVALWDAEAKRRMRQYQGLPEGVHSLGFSGDGKYLAIGTCPNFEHGMEDYSGVGRTHVFIRELSETEAKGKGSK